jgi:hypothetical protein
MVAGTTVNGPAGYGSAASGGGRFAKTPAGDLPGGHLREKREVLTFSRREVLGLGCRRSNTSDR